MKKRKSSSNSFTTYADGLTNVLKNDVEIVAAVGAEVEWARFVAIWDTGATNTVVTKRVAESCRLKSTGMVQIDGVNSTGLAPTYFVNIRLPNTVEIQGLKVSQADRLVGDAEILIGMDIINLGDFAVSSWQQRTMFSFQIPSLGPIDFLPANQRPRDPFGPAEGRVIGRNSPCPCGSGKKYKLCHGRS